MNKLILLCTLAAAPLAAQRPVVMPQAPCRVRTPVPALAPDTVAERVLDSLGTVPAAFRPGVTYIRNLLAVRFDDGTTQSLRQAAVDRVCGVVVGGDHSDGGEDGYYLVRLHGAADVAGLDAAASAIRRMPGVRSAQTLAVRSAEPAAAPPPGATGTAQCANPARGGRLRVDALKQLLASSEPDDQRIAIGLGLVGTDTATVRAESDDAVCARVSAAIAQGAHVELTDRPWVVLRAGARYVAFDPQGVNRSYFVVDTTFVFRKVLR